MYAGEPRSGPVAVMRSLSTTCAMPKSHSTTVPSSRIITFSGLMSRWMIPTSWAQLKARAISLLPGTFVSDKPSVVRPKPMSFEAEMGAILERLNWLGDTSANGFKQSYGMMVNYRYKLGDVDANHEAYAAKRIVASRDVRALAKA